MDRDQLLGGGVPAVPQSDPRAPRAHEMVIHAGSVNRDHVHLSLSIRPSLSVSRAVQDLKGRSFHKVLAEFGIAILGPAPMGTRLLGLHERQRDG